MIKKIDKPFVFALIAVLLVALFVQLANLIGFGSQEIFLNHPEYPEGEEFKRDLEFGRKILTTSTLITGLLLALAIFSRIRKNYLLFNWTSLLTFILIGVLPVIAFYNEKKVTGLIMSAFVFIGILLSVFQMSRKTLNPTKPKAH
jgi:hypothetical protein